MLVCNPYEIVIQGITSNGKTFRPSDWSERLCGILSSFDNNRLSYHDWVRPILVDDVRCVAVDKKLEQINESMFRFLMDFAHDNDLRIVDCKALLEEQADNGGGTSLDEALQARAEAEAQAAAEAKAAAEAQAAAEAAKAQAQEPAPGRELAAADLELAYALLKTRLPQLGVQAEFVRLAQAAQARGQRFILWSDKDGAAQAVAVFTIRHSLLGEPYLEIDELALAAGIAPSVHAAMLRQLVQQAQAAGCKQLRISAALGGAEQRIWQVLTQAELVAQQLVFGKAL